MDNLKSIYFFSLFLRIGITKAKEEYDERAAITKKRDEEINMFHKTKEKERKDHNPYRKVKKWFLERCRLFGANKSVIYNVV